MATRVTERWLAGVMFLSLGCSAAGRALVASKVDTATLDGRYELLTEESFTTLRKQVAQEQDPQRKQAGLGLISFLAANWADLRIAHGVIHCGRVVVQEFSLVDASATGDGLAGTAIWHEDMKDLGDSSRVQVALRTSGDRLEFQLGVSDGKGGDTFVYKRAKE